MNMRGGGETVGTKCLFCLVYSLRILSDHNKKMSCDTYKGCGVEMTFLFLSLFLLSLSQYPMPILYQSTKRFNSLDYPTFLSAPSFSHFLSWLSDSFALVIWNTLYLGTEESSPTPSSLSVTVTDGNPVSLLQYVEYFIDRGVLGVTKEVQHLILEYRGDSVKPNTRHKWDSAQSLVVPVMPPSLVGICRLLQVYYVLKVMYLFKFIVILQLQDRV